MNIPALVADLHRLGFFKFVPPSRLEDVQQRIARAFTDNREPDINHYRYLGPWRRCSEEERYWYANAESLADQGVATFIWDLVPLLRRESVTIDVLIDSVAAHVEPYRSRYDVIVNDRSYPIYEYDGDARIDTWALAHRRTVEIVDDLLRTAGSRERAFGCAYRNDAGVQILTEELFEYIRQLPLHDLWRPLKASEIVVHA